jgi:BirA family transcriptional regulator, biotin operon repressor / biotin---[acetyl-CoA-carboxylase] ligase
MSEWQDSSLPDGWRLEVLEEAGSTNDELRSRGDEARGLVVLAERQTAGRGRRGAAWVSAPGESLTFSVLLRPTEGKALWPRLSLAAGLAVAEALGRFGVEAQIKWPNDVLVGGKKICGILVEAAADFVIVGIGLNVGTREFPEGLDATSMCLELGAEVQRAEVLSQVLRSLNGWSGEIGAGFPDLLERVRERCALSGENVCLMNGERRVQGRALGVGDGGELLVETERGKESFVQAHEVRVVV